MHLPPTARVPQYPRPVPYISPEEAPTCPETVVYEQWTDEAEEEAKKRAAKRRRTIQEAANSYLREEPVFILSASLRGPFDEGWKNPWAVKRQQKDAEIPETAAKQALWRKSLMAAVVQADKGVVIEPTPLQQAISDQRPEATEEQANVFNARSHIVQPLERITRPSSAKKVEEWLKRNQAEAAGRHIQVRSSPTPVTRIEPQSSAAGGYDNPFFVRDDDDLPPEPTGVAKDSFSVRDEYDLPHRSQSAGPHHESPKRAELAILEQKRQSVHRVPPSTHLPEFEYRRPRSRGQKTAEEPIGGREESNSASLDAGYVRDAGREQVARSRDAQPGLEKGGKAPIDEARRQPGLSTESSRASTVQQNLPSAQVTDAPRLATVPSIAHSTEEMLHSVPPVPSKEPSKVDVPRGPAAGDQVFDSEKENKPSSQANIDPAPAVEAPAASLEKTPVREPETQELIAAIKPFDFSTIRKPLKPGIQRATPVTATKATKAKEKKKASFALSSPSSEGSQKSIKASMKITKASSRPALGKSSPQRTAFVSLDSNVEEATRDDKATLDDSLPSVSAMFGQKKTDAPRSILKSSAMASTAPAPTATNNTTSTSAKPDAQVIPEPPVPVARDDEDEDFDLDAAMDDLGSYLGTWSGPEEEARKLAA